MRTEEQEYVEQIANDILNWCEQLVKKNKLDFKLVECKEKFMVIHERLLTLACELLCTRNKICVDEASRRLIVYKVAPGVVEAIKGAADKEKEVETARKAALKPAPRPVAEVAPKSLKVEKEVRTAPEKKPESKKAKIYADTPAIATTTTLLPAPSAKKQKINNDTAGVKKIFSYFPVQGSSANAPTARAVPAALAPSRPQFFGMATHDENSVPKSNANNINTNNTSNHSKDTTSFNKPPPSAALFAKPKTAVAPPAVKIAPSPLPVRIVLPISESPKQPAKPALAADIMNAICAIVRSEFEAGNNEVDICELLAQADGVTEAQFKDGLEELQSRNYLMIVGATVFEI